MAIAETIVKKLVETDPSRKHNMERGRLGERSGWWGADVLAYGVV